MADQDRPKTETEDEVLKAIDAAEENSPSVFSAPLIKPDSQSDPGDEDIRPKPVDPVIAPHIAADPDPVTPLVTPPVAVKKSGRGGFLGAVFGGVIAAGAGYALAVYAPIPGLPMAQPQVEPAAVQAIADRVGTLETKPAPAPDAELANRVVALEGRIDSLPAASAQGVDPEVSNQLQSLTDTLTTLQSRLQAVETRPVAAGTAGLSPDVTAEIETLRAGIEAKAAEAEARLIAAEEQAKAVQAQTEETGRKAAARAALGRLHAALETGAPFETALTQLQGYEIPASLTDAASRGVPSQPALELAFPPAAREALTAALHADMGATWGARIGSFLQSATSARSLTPREGGDPDAILSRAEAALQQADLPKALAEIASLPAAGQAEMAAWVALAQRRIDASAAAATLAAEIEG